jgi:hypothetical protein
MDPNYPYKVFLLRLRTYPHTCTVSIIMYLVSTMKRPHFGDISKFSKCFCGVKALLLARGLEIPPKCWPFSEATVGVKQRCPRRSVVISYIKLNVA